MNYVGCICSCVKFGEAEVGILTSCRNKHIKEPKCFYFCRKEQQIENLANASKELELFSFNAKRNKTLLKKSSNIALTKNRGCQEGHNSIDLPEQTVSGLENINQMETSLCILVYSCF